MSIFRIKPYEFWHPRVFETPFYFYLAWQCLLNRVGIRSLAKANYVLNHGEIGIGSKFHTQHQFPQSYFLPTEIISGESDTDDKIIQLEKFADSHGYPLIVKPDIGMVGKGILKLSNIQNIRDRAIELEGDYLLQKYTALPLEYGVFYIHQNGAPKITGINRKHFPTVTGNGVDSILSLARQHDRYTHHWSTFLQYIDIERIPDDGEEVRLSFIGSHTMGCMFTDDTKLLTSQLSQQVFTFFESQQGFNFGRMDVKTASEEAFLKGEFTVIEVNGISSLPTHMFDPSYSLLNAYKIFFEHGKYLAQIAREFRHQPMSLLPLREIAKRVRHNQNKLDKIHLRLKDSIT